MSRYGHLARLARVVAGGNFVELCAIARFVCVPLLWPIFRSAVSSARLPQPLFFFFFEGGLTRHPPRLTIFRGFCISGGFQMDCDSCPFNSHHFLARDEGCLRHCTTLIWWMRKYWRDPQTQRRVDRLAVYKQVEGFRGSCRVMDRLVVDAEKFASYGQAGC